MAIEAAEGAVGSGALGSPVLDAGPSDDLSRFTDEELRQMRAIHERAKARRLEQA